jgi:hypothetical protein
VKENQRCDDRNQEKSGQGQVSSNAAQASEFHFSSLRLAFPPSTRIPAACGYSVRSHHGIDHHAHSFVTVPTTILRNLFTEGKASEAALNSAALNEKAQRPNPSQPTFCNKIGTYPTC